ncbi:unnamed protein product [Acanthoscelides obtectus]|uniref:SH2 domain-containing protein n=1 Tax=Acanthoscelides obtectus TaxID=200917 RepID=A0A9P0JKH1_ACAOB|nr:unnamed protein product [Acanthoscelides obtectus]CAK1634897.1 hypothetical protein AOBTE_LOCUS8951 [Acanthoscelides obtectus]
MDKFKQMCWCFKVFFHVLANLTSRACQETSQAFYKMCCVFCCWSTIGKESTVQEIIREAREDFYKELTRQSAEELLRPRQNGTFVIRPSKSFHLGVLSVIQDNRIFHLSIRKREDGLVALGNEKPDEKCFTSLDCLINYYISNYLLLYSEGKEYSTLLLPYKDNKNDVD